MWRDLIGSCWLGPGCPVLRADTRENPVGKNGVMTAMSLCMAYDHIDTFEALLMIMSQDIFGYLLVASPR